MFRIVFWHSKEKDLIYIAEDIGVQVNELSPPRIRRQKKRRRHEENRPRSRRSRRRKSAFPTAAEAMQNPREFFEKFWGKATHNLTKERIETCVYRLVSGLFQ